jgi:MarR family transcriptional repressor of emrRAB
MALEFLSPIHKATRQIGECLRPSCDELDLGTAEGHLVSYVAAYGPCSISTLTRVFGTKPSTLTSMLDRLENRGLVHRRLSPEDRRSFQIDMTAEGRRVADRLRVALEALEAAIRAKATLRDREGFRAVMEAIAALTIHEPIRRENR